MAQPQLQLDLDGNTDLELRSFLGHEQFSQPCRFELDVQSKADLDAKTLLGKTAEITVLSETGETRVFHGLVARIAREQLDVASGLFQFHVTVAPWFWFLGLHHDCRIFQGKDILEIFHEIATEHGFDSQLDDSLVRATLPKLDTCVQYRESDLAFISRLLEEHGIFYFFRFVAGNHTMVLGDSRAAYEDVAEKSVKFSAGDLVQSRLWSWGHAFDSFPGKSTLRDFNPFESGTPIPTGSTDALDPIKDGAKLEVYDYPGRFLLASEGGDKSKSIMESLEASHSVIVAAGNVRDLLVAGKFELDETFADANSKATDTEFVVTAIDHVATAFANDDRGNYTCTIQCIPASVLFRPTCSTRKPVIAGPQTAFVTVPSGEEIHTDALGRIKVQFHWDRVGEFNEKSSAFVRVSQPWAGNGFGAWFLPRVDDEVVVTFLEGDPDRPLVTGCVYNAEFKPPYTPDSTPTITGIKSRSTKEGAADNFNEIKFDDKKGEELFHIQAEKNRTTLVKADDTEEVGGNQGVTVKGNSTRKVEGDDGEALEVSKGPLTHTVVESGFVLFTKDTIQVVTSEGDIEVRADAGSRTTEIKKDDTLVLADGGRTVQIKTGDDSLKISVGNHAVKIEAGKSETEAMQSIELKVGQNSIKIEQSGITIKGMMVKIEGTTQTEVKGLMLQLSGDAMAQLKGGVTMIG